MSVLLCYIGRFNILLYRSLFSGVAFTHFSVSPFHLFEQVGFGFVCGFSGFSRLIAPSFVSFTFLTFNLISFYFSSFFSTVFQLTSK